MVCGFVALGQAQSVSGTVDRAEWTVRDAVLSALAHHRGLRVERWNPERARQNEREAESVFDPTLTAGVGGQGERREGEWEGETVAGGAGVSKDTTLGGTLAGEVQVTRSADAEAGETYQSAAELTVSQPLLQGFGRGTTLTTVRQARLDTAYSRAELEGFTAALVEEVETRYWDWVLAVRRTEIYEESLKLAEQQANEVEHRVRVGSLPETELAAARAEIARRRVALINSRSQATALEVQLWRLIRPEALADPERRFRAATDPVPPPVETRPLPERVATALRTRPELRQARLLVDRGELELVKTRNGLLPRLDFFVTLGKTGYADSFGRAVEDLDGDEYRVETGLNLEWPWAQRGARARHRSAAIGREQAAESVAHLEALVREDVETAVIEVERNRQQVAATATMRQFEEEKVRAETAKFRVGKSTALLVAQAQRDLVLSQVAEVESATGLLKALVTLDRLEGVILPRRNIEVREE